MLANNLKTEIVNLIEQMPESVLQDLLNYLKQAQSQSKNQMELSIHLKKILSEDKDLLQRLAQ